MIYKQDHRIKRINVDGKEIYRVYFNDEVVFKKYHPVTAVVSMSHDTYVDSEMKDFWVDDMDFEIIFSNNWNSTCIWGCRPDKSYQEFDVICGNDKKLNIRKGGTQVNGTAPGWYQQPLNNYTVAGYNLLQCQTGDSNTPNSFDLATIHDIKKEGDKAYLDGQLMTFQNASTCQDFFLTYLPPYFFRLNQKDYELDASGINSFNDNGIKYLFRAIFYYKGKLYRDFIPVLDQNNVPALYEKVTKKFHYSLTDTPLEYFNGTYAPVSCICNCNSTNYIDTQILPKDISKWTLRMQSHNSTAISTKTLAGMGSINGTSGLYFTQYLPAGKGTTCYEFHIGTQKITTDIPFLSDCEIYLTFDLINKKVTVQRNHQFTLEPVDSYTYDITSTESLADLPALAIGKINGAPLAEGGLNFRVYQSKIYDKNGQLIQKLIPKLNFTTKKGCMYDELTKTPYATGTIRYI